MSKIGAARSPRAYADHIVNLHCAAGARTGAAGDTSVNIDRDRRVRNVELGDVLAYLDGKRPGPRIPIDSAQLQNAD
jgi:hypothetical protein